MRVVALVSGGKDSCYNMMQCIAAGHQIVALANLVPSNNADLNSYMYQSVGYEAIDYIAQAMDLPLFKKITCGQSIQRDKDYQPTDNDEVEDLYDLLKNIKQSLEYDAVACGAILSDYQRIRVENVCIRLGLVSLTYLWQRKQDELLQEMIKCEIDAIVIKVAALGLDPARHLARSIRLLEPHLISISEKYGVHVCGEGGEYETLTLDCPLFKSRLVIVESEIINDSNDNIAPVGYLKLKSLKLEEKLPQLDLATRLVGLPLKDCNGHITEDSDNSIIEIHATDVQEDSNSTDDIVCAVSTSEQDCSSELNQAEHVATSNSGWLWMGGITGCSIDNPLDAFEQAMNKLKSALDANNHKLEHICSISMYVGNMSIYKELNEIYCNTLNHTNPPTRACVQVPLPPHCPVILEAISWKMPNTSGDVLIERNTIHVQSISHWCPASIGPYSQVIKVGGLIHLAGQIGLVPGSMELVEGGFKSQCQLSLRHVQRLIKCIDSNCDLRDIVQGVCFLTDQKYVECARKIWEEKSNNGLMDYVVVSSLPRNALVEWHVWAHSHNHQFEYEETGQCIQDWSIAIYRRWNYENNISTIVCHVDNSNQNTILSAAIMREALDYILDKLNGDHDKDPNSICSLKIFYSLSNKVCAYSFTSVMEDFQKTMSVVYTVVPVISLKSKYTFMSICGVRLR